MVPEGECDRDDEEKRSEPAPGELADRRIGAGFATHVFFNFAGFIFTRFGFCGNGREVAGRLQVFGNGLIFVEANETRIGANEAFVENASGQLAEVILFQRLQHAGADFGGDGNLLQCDLAFLALLFQSFAKGRQSSLPLSPDGERNSTLSRNNIIDYLVVVLSRELRASSEHTVHSSQPTL